MVTGGTDGGYERSYTEILTEGSPSWKDVGQLPDATYGLKGVSLDNRIIMTGKSFNIITTI